MRNKINLKETYLQTRNIRDYMIIPKSETTLVKNRASNKLETGKDLICFLDAIQTQGIKKIYLQDINMICPTVFIYQDVAYFSEGLSPKLLSVKQLKSLLNLYSKDRNEIKKLIQHGLIIFDIDNLDGESFVYMDRKNQIILFVEKNCAFQKLNNPIKDFQNLDKDCNISDELYDFFFPKDDMDDDVSFDDNVTKYDEEYFEWMEEYGEEYEE